MRLLATIAIGIAGLISACSREDTVLAYRLARQDKARATFVDQPTLQGGDLKTVRLVRVDRLETSPELTGVAACAVQVRVDCRDKPLGRRVCAASAKAADDRAVVRAICQDRWSLGAGSEFGSQDIAIVYALMWRPR